MRCWYCGGRVYEQPRDLYCFDCPAYAELHEGRWKVFVPVGAVPWASGTVADMECYSRFGTWPYFTTKMYDPNCCRWPKSCSAFDPGFTTGKGPTTLPVVWFDGFGYRSGPPDPTTIPEHLFADIHARWKAVTDDGCNYCGWARHCAGYCGED